MTLFYRYLPRTTACSSDGLVPCYFNNFLKPETSKVYVKAINQHKTDGFIQFISKFCKK